jgi:hypothetical protein
LRHGYASAQWVNPLQRVQKVEPGQESPDVIFEKVWGNRIHQFGSSEVIEHALDMDQVGFLRSQLGYGSIAREIEDTAYINGCSTIVFYFCAERHIVTGLTAGAVKR